MSTVLAYKCPCCGGKIEFSSELQQMQCPFCDATFDPASLKEYDEALRQEQQQEPLHWDSAEKKQWQREETESVAVFTCQSCGGELITEQTTAATSCPFCGSPVILTGRLSGDLKPDYVIPFQLDKAAAKAALKKHFSGKKLLPSLFSEEAHLDEIKGVYVPFWLFDADADAKLRYHATRTRFWSDSNYNYTETTHFALLREGTIGFDRVPVDGSSKMADELMESLEPFDFSKAVDFQTAFLSGYMADSYDVSAEQSGRRASERITRSTSDAFAATAVGYATVVPEQSNVRLQNSKTHYALYPVWLLSTSWRGKSYLFAMNGQSGKMVGDLPMDKGKYWRYFGLWSAILSAVSFGALWLLLALGVL